MDDETICPEMQGMFLVEDIRGDMNWLHLGIRMPVIKTMQDRRRILRSSYHLACRHGIEDWELSDYWGAVCIFEEDDGRAIGITRGFVNPSSRTLIFATSEAFWIKMVLKYRGS